MEPRPLRVGCDSRAANKKEIPRRVSISAQRSRIWQVNLQTGFAARVRAFPEDEYQASSGERRTWADAGALKRESIPQGLKPTPPFGLFSARLKSCPVTEQCSRSL